MAENNEFDNAFVLKVACTTGDQVVEFLAPKKRIHLVSDGDCFVNFNKPVTTSGRFLIKANIPFEVKTTCSSIHYLAAATPNLYICASN